MGESEYAHGDTSGSAERHEPDPADQPVDTDPWPVPPSSSPDPFVLRPGPDPAWD